MTPAGLTPRAQRKLLTEALVELVDAHELDLETRDDEARAMIERLAPRALPPRLADMDPVLLRFMLRTSKIGVSSLGAVEQLAPGLLKRVAPHGLLPPTRLLRDGSTGWYIRDGRKDDCWASAVATCLQFPIGELPDPRIDERLEAGETPEEIDRSAWEAFGRWLAWRGLRMVVHRKLPIGRRRWLGIVPLAGWFQNHALVMTRDEVLFDPISAIAYSRPILSFGRPDVEIGLSFRALKTPPHRGA